MRVDPYPPRTNLAAALHDGRGLGHALICADARYASIAWLGTDRLDRRFVEPAEWRMFLLALGHHLPPEILPSTHIVPAMLLPPERRKSIAIQYVTELPIEAAPARVAEQLDTLLRALAQANR